MFNKSKLYRSNKSNLCKFTYTRVHSHQRQLVNVEPSWQPPWKCSKSVVRSINGVRAKDSPRT